MSVTVGTIYLQCSQILLEDGGLQLGLFTQADFLRLAGEVISDFLNKTGICDKIVCIQAQAGIDTYLLPEVLTFAQAGAFGQQYMHHTSAFYLDNSSSMWQASTGLPNVWKQDEISPKKVQISPNPDMDGNACNTNLGQGFYGVLSAVSNTNDINFLGPPTGLFGVINGFTGNPYMETLNPGYGVLNYMCASPTNLEIIGSTTASSLVVALNSYIQLIPDSLTPAIKYGILSRLLAQDGECKDLNKSNYCSARYNESVNLCAAIMAEAFQQD